MPGEFATPYLCRHIKTNGRQCQSSSLRGEHFCYFHARLHKNHPAPLTARQMVHLMYDSVAQEAIRGSGEDPMQIARAYPKQNELNFPALEDSDSIQLAASILFHAVAQGQIHLRRARFLRDILRIACTSSGRNSHAREAAEFVIQQVSDVEITSEGLAIAPPQDSPADRTIPCVIDSQPQQNEYSASNPPESNILPGPSEGTRVN